MMMKIGLFLPQSDMFSKLSLEFMNGIRLPFKTLETGQPQFLIENIGNGSEIDMIKKIEKMLLQDEADAIVCFCGYFLLDQLVKIGNTYKKPIFHITLGARVLKQKHYSPYLIHQSLNLSHTAYLSAQIGVEKYGKKAAMLSSFYDGGYHMAEAFYNGILDNGGEIVFNYVSPMDYQSESFENMISGLIQSKPDFVFMIFSFNEAKKIMDILLKNGFEDLPKIGIPLMTDESMLTNDAYPNNFFSIASCAFDSNENDMNHFKSLYQEYYSESPNIIGLLGFEVGTMVLQCIQDEGKIPNQIGDFFKNKTIKSPRGHLNLTSFNETITTEFKLRKLEPVNGKFHNSVIEKIENYSATQLYKKMAEVPDTGWKNPYICT
jgi:branched-chain amino acid transport system substrate-binding protein